MNSTLLTAGPDHSVLVQWNPTVDRIVREVMAETARLGGAATASFFQRNESGRIHPAIFHDVPDADESSVASECLRRRSSCVFRANDEIGGHRLSRAAAGILLSIPEGDIGAIVLKKPEDAKYFFDDEFSVAKALGASFGMVLRGALFVNDDIYSKIEHSLMLLLENVHLNRKVRESDSRLRTVLEVSNLINSSRQISEMIEAVLHSAVQVIRADSASLFLIDEATGELVFDVITGVQTLRGVRIPQGQGIVGLCAAQKQPILVNDAQNDPRLYRAVDEVSRITTRNLMACPLMIGSECIGVIEVINKISQPDFLVSDLDTFSSFSDSVAIALQRRRLIDNIESANRELERRLRENKCLHRVTATMVEARTTDELFNGVLAVLTDELGLRRASIMLYDRRQDRLEIHASVGLPVLSPEELSVGLGRYVLEKKVPFYISDIRENEELSRFSVPGRYTSDSCILVPMIEDSAELATGILSVSDPEKGVFDPDDFRIIFTAVSQIVKGYVSFKLSEQLLEKKAMEKEIEITSRIQRDILPSTVPAHEYLDVAARSVMAKTMGGDFYDYYREGPGERFTVLVADVSGKSLPAALFMAVSSSVLRTMIRTEHDPAQILTRSNDLLFEESESGMFVTVFLCQFDPQSRSMRFASAGHNEMLLLHHDGRYEILRARGAPLGVIPSAAGFYEGKELLLQEGDLLILYTDGIVEALNKENEEFGLDRFVQILLSLKNRPLREIIDHVYGEIQEFSGNAPLYDDFTMLATRFNSPVSQEYRFVYPAVQESIPLFVEEVATLLGQMGVRGQDLGDLLLACDEVSTNIVSYSFDGLMVSDPRFHCVVQKKARRVCITFIDGGRNYDFNTLRRPDPEGNLSGTRKGGFGIFLVRTLMDRTDYVHRDGMNYLSLEKNLS